MQQAAGKPAFFPDQFLYFEPVINQQQETWVQQGPCGNQAR
jgi:hypothetical protein